MRRGFRIAIVTVVSLIWGGVVAVALVIGAIGDLLTSGCTDGCTRTHNLLEWGATTAIITLLWLVLAIRWIAAPQPGKPPPPLGRAAQPATFDE